MVKKDVFGEIIEEGDIVCVLHKYGYQRSQAVLLKCRIIRMTDCYVFCRLLLNEQRENISQEQRMYNDTVDCFKVMRHNVCKIYVN